MEQVQERIEEAFMAAEPGHFESVEVALAVAGSALKYLMNQCEDVARVADEPETPNTD
jgi:hypothetical protein